jgi:hypothetical protein
MMEIWVPKEADREVEQVRRGQLDEGQDLA